MKRILSTVLVVILLLGLGALAVLARGGDALVPVRTASVAAAPVMQGEVVDAAEPDAPMTVLGWNAIGVPLSTAVTTADQLKTHIESFCDPACPGSVERVSKWDPVNQIWVTRAGGFDPPDFDIYPGQALMVGIKAGADISSFAWIGDVPPQCPTTGCIRYGISSGLPELVQTGWNFIIIPLDKTSAAMADALKLDIDSSGKVTRVSKWDANDQIWITRAGGFDPPDFSITPGYPYMIYADGIATTTWPRSWP